MVKKITSLKLIIKILLIIITSPIWFFPTFYKIGMVIHDNLLAKFIRL